MKIKKLDEMINNADPNKDLALAQRVGRLFGIPANEIGIDDYGVVGDYDDEGGWLADTFGLNTPITRLSFGDFENTEAEEYPVADVIDNKISIGIAELSLCIDGNMLTWMGFDEGEPPFYTYEEWKRVADKVDMLDILQHHFGNGETWPL